MKLYFSTGTISMPCVMALYEANIDCPIVEVSWKRNLNVEELNKYSPLGKVPALVFDSGEVLTQTIAILTYLAELKPESGLLAAAGSLERAQTLSWMSLGLSDLWPKLALAFQSSKLTDDARAQQQIRDFARSTARPFLDHLGKHLEGKRYVMGATFTLADCFFAAELPLLELALGKFENDPEIRSYMVRLAERPSVQKARAL